MADIDPEVLRELRARIADPGAFLPRGDNYTEPITSWSARAVASWLATRDARVAGDAAHQALQAARDHMGKVAIPMMGTNRLGSLYPVTAVAWSDAQAALTTAEAIIQARSVGADQENHT